MYGMKRGCIARWIVAASVIVAGGTWMSAEGASGVCCVPGFVCTIGDRLSCAQAGGAYQGDGTTCAPENPCRLLTGACCVVEPIIRASEPPTTFMDPPCSDCPKGWKGNLLGTAPVRIDFQNFRSVCVIQTAEGCTVRNGVYQGNGTVCEPNPCPVPPPVTGACCSLDVSLHAVCRMDTPAGCAASAATFTAVGTACSATVCSQPATGACCRTFSGYTFCAATSNANCEATAGKYEGDGSACGPTTCPAPVLGTCCRGATAVRGAYCAVETDYTCFGSGTQFAGAVTSCAASACARSCPCDWDRNGYLSSNDLIVFLNDWLAGHGDFNAGGGTDIQDYVEFVNCYLGTNPACIRG